MIVDGEKNLQELIEYYADQFWKIGYRINFGIYFDGTIVMYTVNIKTIHRNMIEAGGGFRDPIEAFYYFDALLKNHKNHGCLLPKGIIIGNSTP